MLSHYRDGRRQFVTREAPRSRGLESNESLIDKFDNVMEFLRPKIPDASTKDHGAVDLNTALTMVNRAAEVMGALERRVSDMEAEGLAQVEQARYDLEIAEARVASYEKRALDSEARTDELEARLRQAQRRAAEADELEARLQEIEQRAKEADEWLKRFCETITTVFQARLATTSKCIAA